MNKVIVGSTSRNDTELFVEPLSNLCRAIIEPFIRTIVWAMVERMLLGTPANSYKLLGAAQRVPLGVTSIRGTAGVHADAICRVRDGVLNRGISEPSGGLTNT